MAGVERSRPQQCLFAPNHQATRSESDQRKSASEHQPNTKKRATNSMLSIVRGARLNLNEALLLGAAALDPSHATRTVAPSTIRVFRELRLGRHERS